MTPALEGPIGAAPQGPTDTAPGEPGTPCSDTARERRDPLIGSAAPARGWLLLEHSGPWRVDALLGSGIDPVIRRRLVSAAADVGVRVLLVRRHGRRPAGVARCWLLCRPGRRTVTGSWADDADLAGVETALGGVETTLGSAELGAPDPLLLVCTHGIHDRCCATRGRPVAAALTRRWPDLTWECTHVGGDRFAANLLVVPDGACYGGLDPKTAVAVVAGHLKGRLDLQHLRGVSTLPVVAQPAAAAVQARFGPGPAQAVRLNAVRALGQDRWQVDLSSDLPGPSRLRADVARAVRPAARLTCRAHTENRAAEYVVLSLQPRD